MYAERQDYSRAVYVLAQARERAPKRPDIVLALARSSEEAGYYGDSALAYDEYLQLRPGEDTVRRDRARVYGHTGTRLEEGLKELAWYVRKHPNDPVGYFDQAQFLWRTDPEKALNQLSTAVRLDPNFGAARYGRAWLLHRLGKTAESLPDLKAAVRIDPKNVRVLDQLGLAYLSLDRPGEAEMVLRQALAVSPDDAEALMHLGRALMALNRGEEAKPLLAKFQKVRKAKPRDPRREAGMIELATLPLAERTERQIERLRRDARAHPGDAELQLHLASLLLADGRREEAAAEFRDLLTRNADTGIWEQAGAALVRAEQYDLARQFLQRMAPGVDLAIALFFTEGPIQALEAIEKAPDGDQDALLMKARILDAAGRGAEAQKVLAEGLRRAMPRPQVAQQTALLLLRHDRKREALDFLDEATKRYPDYADLLLTQAIVQSLTGQTALAEKTVREIELRWPEWDRAYVAHGLLLERAGRAAEARQRFETAIVLGSQDAGARCALARLKGLTNRDPGCACASEIEEMLFPSCKGR
jgi:tetratricopeptide (TPR) repeat protein